MVKSIPEGHIVEEFKIGNTCIKICDDYCRNCSSGEIQQILDRCGEIWAESETLKAKQD
ncbi:MAG: hypothetical protein PHE09_13785 [Oscillospiraceae bacterium]|jgi:muramidase (phage lysozyme)|nr:hypothetical protein [Oscillospiraceae bacterium]